MSERPPVTFALFTYNQERFVAEALQGALSQTYSPLEIVVSDDASPDGTYPVLQELVGKYRGPHRVVLRRNKTNMGTGPHVEQVYRSCRGQYIVNAAGDDVSFPGRVEALVGAFETGSDRPSLVHSNAWMMLEDGSLTGDRLLSETDPRRDVADNPLAASPAVAGCAVAFHRELVDRFPPIRTGILSEDVVLTRRAHLLGGVTYLPEPLVKYRCHPRGVSQWESTDWQDRGRLLELEAKWSRERALRFEQFVEDVRSLRPGGEPVLEQAARRGIEIEARRMNILNNGAGKGLLDALREVLVARGMRGHLLKVWMLRWAPRGAGLPWKREGCASGRFG